MPQWKRERSFSKTLTRPKSRLAASANGVNHASGQPETLPPLHQYAEQGDMKNVKVYAKKR